MQHALSLPPCIRPTSPTPFGGASRSPVSSCLDLLQPAHPHPPPIPPLPLHQANFTNAILEGISFTGNTSFKGAIITGAGQSRSSTHLLTLALTSTLTLTLTLTLTRTLTLTLTLTLLHWQHVLQRRYHHRRWSVLHSLPLALTPIHPPSLAATLSLAFTRNASFQGRHYHWRWPVTRSSTHLTHSSAHPHPHPHSPSPATRPSRAPLSPALVRAALPPAPSLSRSLPLPHLLH
ncbi:unnamed protein product [Closterium sp. NIES-53]